MGRRKKKVTVENLWDFSDLLKRLSPSYDSSSDDDPYGDEREPKSPEVSSSKH